MVLQYVRAEPLNLIRVSRDNRTVFLRTDLNSLDRLTTPPSEKARARAFIHGHSTSQILVVVPTVFLILYPVI